MEEKEDQGGLMYQQLRKFINVIVSFFLYQNFNPRLFRMN